MLCDKKMKFWCKVAALRNKHRKEKAPDCVPCTQSLKEAHKVGRYNKNAKIRHF